VTLAVVDTGVLVGGVYWRYEPHQCVQAWLKGLLVLVISDAIYVEYERVLDEVKAEQGFHTDVAPWLDAIRTSALWVTPEPLSVPVCRDPHDDKFIAAALAAKARLVLARDPDLTVLRKPFGIEILTPRQCLARLPRALRRQLR
jgi:uncharacterized protein